MPTIITLGEGTVIVVSGIHRYDEYSQDAAYALVLDPRDEPIGPEDLKGGEESLPIKDSNVVLRFKTSASVELLIGELESILSRFGDGSIDQAILESEGK